MRRAAAAKRSEATGSARTFANAGLCSAGLTALSVRAKPCIDCACPRWPVNRHSSLRGVGKFLIETELSVTVFEERLVDGDSPRTLAAYHGAEPAACEAKRRRIITIGRFAQSISAAYPGNVQARDCACCESRTFVENARCVRPISTALFAYFASFAKARGQVLYCYICGFGARIP